jgi:ELWxxDGT repeat protein
MLAVPLTWAFVLAATLAEPAHAGQATLVRDINAAPRVSSSRPRSFLPFGGRTLFLASTPAQSEEPWVTDGTASGTYLLTDLEPRDPLTLTLALSLRERESRRVPSLLAWIPLPQGEGEGEGM